MRMPVKPTSVRTNNPVPSWWLGFALAWLLIVVISMALMIREPMPAWRRGAILTLLTLLAGLYLASVLRSAPGDCDLARPRQWYLPVAALVAMIACVAGLVALAPSAGMWWMAMYVVVAAGLTLSPQVSATVISVVTLGVMVGGWAISGHADPRLMIFLAIGAAALAVRHLAVTIAQLQSARGALAHRAVSEERLRIARDLHDLLGHSLSLVAIKSELAGRLLPAAPAQAVREIADIERAARDALRQVRMAVAGYRQPTLQRELAAARELLEAAGIEPMIPTRLGDHLPAAVDSMLAWSVREAVTNVIRHSRASRCEVRLERFGDRVRLLVVDDGIGAAASGAGRRAVDGRRACSGIAGLHERARAVEATVDARPGPAGGFVVLLDAPVHADATGRFPGDDA